MKNSEILSHIKSILILPFSVLVIIPTLLVVLTDYYNLYFRCINPFYYFQIIIGSAFILSGLILMIITIRLFMNEGKGTLAPWKPTQRLVVSGPYRYMRNPMISGVLSILVGESIISGSFLIISWSIFFYLINHLYFKYSEEPGLLKRFGFEYIEYKQNVPRWIPTLKAWKSKRQS